MSKNNLITACEHFIKGWPNFIKCINFNKTNFNAEAIRFFNEVPGEIKQSLETTRKEPKT